MSAPIPASIPSFPTLGETARKQPVRHQSPGCKVLTILCCLATAAAAQSGNFIYTDNGADVTITGYVGKPTEPVGPITIPATILDPVSGLDDPVVSIGASAFFACVNLTKVTIPSSVKTIGISAFSQCIALTEAQLPANGVETISRFAFAGCKVLSNLTLPVSVKSLGTSSFGGCVALTSVAIPSGAAVGISAFSGCSGLTSVSISPSVVSIGEQAFRYCSGLTTITIPDVATLPNLVFANCRGLTTVNIPASVTVLSPTAFAECSSLTSFTVAAANPNFSSLDGLLTNKTQTRLITCPAGVSGDFTIPAALSEIGPQAFQLCEKLTGVTFHSGVTSLGNKAFSTCGKLVNAVFAGNSPVMGSGVFELAGPGFAIHYLTSGTGFTSPSWVYDPVFELSYPAFYLEAVTPEFTWLYANSLPGNSDFLSDANGDGVNLLMAYALNMDPNQRNSLPQPVFGASQMSLSFYAGAAGVSYPKFLMMKL